MPQPRYAENVIQALAQHLGVQGREILLTHDLYRDWRLTPLSRSMLVLLDLEQRHAVRDCRAKSCPASARWQTW